MSTVGLEYDNGLVVSELATAGYMSVSALLNLTSNMPSVVSIDAMGDLALHDNWHSEVIITASLVCDPMQYGHMAIKANLHAAPDDVDLGQVDGYQFQQVDGLLAVPVRIRPPDGSFLVNFQIAVNFDESILTSNTDGSSNGLASYDEGSWKGLDSTLNDPPSSFQLVGSDPSSTFQGTVDLGTVTLNVVGSGVTLITGSIIELFSRRPSHSQLIRTSSKYGIAGDGYADVSIAGRRLMAQQSATPPIALLSPARRVSEMRSRQRARQLQPQAACEPCDARIHGDLSGDCKFTSADVLASQELVSQVQSYHDGWLDTNPLYGMCGFMRRQANPSWDIDALGGAPVIDLVDSYYLQLAVAKKYRFLDDVHVRCSGTDLIVIANVIFSSTKMSRPASPKFADVLFELRADIFANARASDSGITMVNGSINEHRGLNAPNTLLVNAVQGDDGSFVAHISPDRPWTAGGVVEVAILIETMDFSGRKEVPRRYKAFHGSSIQPYASQGLQFAPFHISATCTQPSPPPPTPPPPPLPPALKRQPLPAQSPRCVPA